MKIVLLMSLLLNTTAQAASQAIFIGVSGEVRLFVQSTKASDTDARQFFEMLNAPVKIDGGNEKKAATFRGSDGVPLDFSCSLSIKMGIGNCQIIFRSAANVKIDKANKFIDYRLTNSGEINDLKSILKLPEGRHPAYITSDGRFTIAVQSSGLSLQYQE